MWHIYDAESLPVQPAFFAFSVYLAFVFALVVAFLLSLLDFPAPFFTGVVLSFFAFFPEDFFADSLPVTFLFLEDDAFFASEEDCLNVVVESFDDEAFLVFVSTALAFLPPFARR